MLKKIIKNNPVLLNLLAYITHVIGFNSINMGGGKLEWNGVFSKKLKLVNHGKNNTVKFGKGCRLYNCKIEIFGNDNNIWVEDFCELRNASIWISDGSTIKIGHNTWCTGEIHIACIEKTIVEIGAQCLFSNEITIRTGDSHSILDENGKRINPSKNICIGEHVWVGQKVTILKGANIGNGSVIGTGALVTGKEYQANSIIAGFPAKIIKNNVVWDHRLI